MAHLLFSWATEFGRAGQKPPNFDMAGAIGARVSGVRGDSGGEGGVNAGQVLLDRGGHAAGAACVIPDVPPDPVGVGCPLHAVEGVHAKRGFQLSQRLRAHARGRRMDEVAVLLLDDILDSGVLDAEQRLPYSMPAHPAPGDDGCPVAPSPRAARMRASRG
jgi:hypothetical protein